MDFHIPSNLIWFLIGAASASVLWVAGLAVLVVLANRAKARCKSKPEDMEEVG